MSDPAPSQAENSGFFPDLTRMAGSLASEQKAAFQYRGDPGIQYDGRKLSFAALIEAAAPHAKVLVLGDTDHHNAGVRGNMGDKKNLTAAKNSGFKHIIAETGIDVDEDIASFIADEMDETALYDTLHAQLSTHQGNEGGDWTRQLVSMAKFSKESGVELHVDYTGYTPVESTAPPGSEAYLRETLAQSKKRFDDEALVDRFNQMYGKVLMQVGFVHFSVDNGNVAAVQGGLTKIDVYASRTDYDRNQQLRHKMNGDIGAHAVKPDLVYFQDTGTVHVTDTARPELRASVEAAAAIEAARSGPDLKNTAQKPALFQP